MGEGGKVFKKKNFYLFERKRGTKKQKKGDLGGKVRNKLVGEIYPCRNTKTNRNKEEERKKIEQKRDD